WVAEIEYNIHDLPPADVTLLLDVPTSTTDRLIMQKQQRSYTGAARDLHERDLGYLSACREVYRELARATFRSEWLTVECVDANGEMLPPDEISGVVWQRVGPR